MMGLSIQDPDLNMHSPEKVSLHKTTNICAVNCIVYTHGHIRKTEIMYFTYLNKSLIYIFKILCCCEIKLISQYLVCHFI